jgi:hypothetical protein
MNVTQIVEQARALTYAQRAELIKRLVDLLPQIESDPQKLHSIAEFEGIAAHLADDEDPQTYLRRIRAEWTDPE